MAITATTLRTNISSGDGGEIADTNAAYAAINAITALLSGSSAADRDTALAALGLTDLNIAEKARDAVGAAIRVAAASASYLTIVPDDAADTITFGVSTGAFLSAIGEPQPIYYNTATNSWPSRTLLPGYTLAYVRWDSQAAPGVDAPPGMIDGDFWDGRRAV